MPKVMLSWSSGKDSAWTLHVLKQDPAVEVVGLMTTVNAVYQRVAMHAVRRVLLEAQARAAGLPLTVVDLPYPCDNETYEKIMGGAVERARDDGVEAFAFGDLFLEDVRAYRERMLDGTGFDILFPLWGKVENTAGLARTMQAGGLRACVTCVDPRKLSRDFAGRAWDADFVADLPEGVDPCGENGEFHTLVHDGPMFNEPVALRPGEVVEREGFVFADFLPDSGALVSE
jgi:uncharacterized protein (TIGR00290 family)